VGLINYPNKKSNSSTSFSTKEFGGRGMELESDITKTNQTYFDLDLAVIYKKPTPITIVKVDYASRSTAKISEAYYKEPSTTDYNGIYKGKYIDFEAKECRSNTSFPFASIHKHQVMHLEKCMKHGAIAFIILRMVNYNETYLIKADDFLAQYKGCTRKSLPYDWIKTHGYLIEYKYSKPCDYLTVVDKVFNI